MIIFIIATILGICGIVPEQDKYMWETAVLIELFVDVVLVFVGMAIRNKMVDKKDAPQPEMKKADYSSNRTVTYTNVPCSARVEYAHRRVTNYDRLKDSSANNPFAPGTVQHSAWEERHAR